MFVRLPTVCRLLWFSRKVQAPVSVTHVESLDMFLKTLLTMEMVEEARILGRTHPLLRANRKL
jgi:hypothetical protein